MGSGNDKKKGDDLTNLSKEKRESYFPGLIETLKSKEVIQRKHAAKSLGDMGDKTVIPYLKEALNDEDESVQINAQEAIDKIMDREKEAAPSKVSPFKQTGASKDAKNPLLIGLGVIIFIIIALIVISSVASQPNTKSTTPASLNNNQVDVNFSNLSNASTASPPATSTPSSSSNSGEDYDKGYDTGYQNGVDDAYYGDPFYDGTSSSLKVSEWWIEGYKTGYKQGYNTIKNGGSLQRPQLSYNAYMDPRSGQTIK